MNRTILFLMLALILSPCLFSQPQNLVFEGSGIRGIAYSGAIRELEERNLLQGVQKLGGTSAGAITALLLSIGYTSQQITEIVNSTSFKKFNDGKYFFFGGINRFKKYYGWYRGQEFDKWLSELIKAKTNNADISFSELHSKGYKDLYVTATCLNKQSLVIFSHEAYPDMKVKDAVRISMSIPLYFEAVFTDASGHIAEHPKDKTGLDVMVDGGFIANFPIKLFDSTKYTDPSQPNRFVVNEHTLGFRIDRQQQIENDANNKGLAGMKISNLGEYVSAFYNIVIENLNRQSLSREDWERTVSISDGNIAPRIRKLSTEEVKILTGNGEVATRAFLGK